MNTMVFNNSVVEVENSGRITISSADFSSSEGDVAALMQLFAKRLSGRMYSNQEGKLVFDPYAKGNNPPTVLAKETVGQVVVTRTPKLIKFTLALPVEMSQQLMSMALLEQSALVSKELREGLYKRMQSRPNNTPTLPAKEEEDTTGENNKDIAA